MNLDGAVTSAPELPEEDRLVVLYASQTGTAADAAERIGREARRRHYRAFVASVDAVPLDEFLDEPLVVFVVATSGQGDEPQSMRWLWRQFLLRSDLPSDLFEHLHYAVLGLGDSTYPRFNWPAKKLDRRLQSLGGTAILERAEADDQDYAGVDTTMDPWLVKLWTALDQLLPQPHKLDPLPPDQRPPPKIRLEPVHAPEASTSKCQPRRRPLQEATVVRNERATASDHFQDVRYFELEADHDLSYQAGDVVELQPENSAADVDRFLSILKWKNPDKPFKLSAASPDRPLPKHWPKVVTLRELLLRFLDVFSVPRRSFFELLAYFTASPEETAKLKEFASAEGQEDLWDYANRPKRNIVEVLAEFRSACIPPEFALDLFPEIRPRQFSIASSSKTSPRRIKMLVAIVNYQTIMKIPRRGVATSWLARLKPGVRISYSLEKGTFALPPQPSVPAVLIGPGTGIAPLKALAEERALQQARGKTETMVIFGCRSRDKDFYYRDEWEAAAQQGRVQLRVAASRDQEDKVYVQHKLKDEAALVWSMLERGGYVYISGSAKQMPAAVRRALRSICESEGGLSEEEAAQYVKDMEETRRLHEETWS